MSTTQSHRSWITDLPLQWKFGSVIIILVTLFIILLAGNSFTISAANTAQNEADRLVHYVELSNAAARAIARRQSTLVQTAFDAPGALPDRLKAADTEVQEAIGLLRQATRKESALRTAADRAQRIDANWSTTAAIPLVELAAQRAQGSFSGERLALQEFLKQENSESGSRAIVTALDDLNAAANIQLEKARQALDEAQSWLRIIDIGALIATFLAGSGALILTSRLIIQPLRQLATLMEKLADHEHTVEVPFTSRGDEIGVIGRALAVFKTMAVETYESNWVKSAVGTVSAKLQSVEDTQAFADDLLTELAPHLNAGVGVFYVFDAAAQTLTLTGSYGYKARRHVTTSYQIGEGLVGQCARTRAPILLAPVPEDYVTIHSGTGEAIPKAVLVVPLINNARLLGVMEFASFEPFTAVRERLVSEITPAAALSFDNLTRAVRTRELLNETQRQATELRVAEEELRTQQEELRATNEQLQRQSQKLAASEEELRVQADELQRSNTVLRTNSEELEAQKAQLERMNQEVETRAADLARANQYKSQFLANMSHELRTPLNSLLILAHDLAENHAAHLDAEEVEAANIIHSSGTNLLRLINDILDLSKVEAGKMDVVHEPVSIPAVAARMERNFRHVAQSKGVDLTITLAPDAPPQIVTDDGKLEQITNNLLSNAFKFTAEGGVTVTFAKGPANADGPTLEIAVTDTGIGIPEDKQDFIFEAFEQVDSSTRRQYGGTGLGLAITQRLAHLLGGAIKVESTLGKGSTFRLTLPVGEWIEDAPSTGAGQPAARSGAIPDPTPLFAPAPVSAAPPVVVEDDRAHLEKGVPTILVVEDDANFAHTLVNLVHRKGYRVLVAGDGEGGLALAQRYAPTGILLDVMLPGMDGWTVISRLKADPSTRHIPVHFVSALDEARRGRDLGAVGFLTKPVSAEALNDALGLLTHFAPDHLRRVLVVDDDEPSRRAVRKLLAGDKVEVAEAGSGEDALALLEKEAFDCMVLDLGLPGMSGFDVLDHLAKSGTSVPVVVYSGRDLTAEESLKLRAFTDSIVVKGALSPERLLDEVSLFLHSVREDPLAGPRGSIIAGAAGTAPADPDGDLKDRKLLLVDDDMRNIYALAKVLRGKGVDVILAQDGAKALGQLHDHPDTEIVLMDIMMPVMDGYEAMAEIRKNPDLARLPIIALTAKAMKDDRDKCLAAGANDYLAKPVDVPKLLSMIRAWLPPR